MWEKYDILGTGSLEDDRGYRGLPGSGSTCNPDHDGWRSMIHRLTFAEVGGTSECHGGSVGASEGTRTLDPPLTKRLLCHLSYAGNRRPLYQPPFGVGKNGAGNDNASCE